MCCVDPAGLSYASHTVGFTPPATLTRAGMSYYNTPGLHVHVGASHGIAVSHYQFPLFHLLCHLRTLF